MTMIEVKTADLIGPALDYAVGMAVDGVVIACTGSVPRWKFPTLEASVWIGDDLGDIERYAPSTAWSDGGPLIERYHLEFTNAVTGTPKILAEPCDADGNYIQPYAGMNGPTHLIAACRAVVMHQLGEAVTVPAELVQVGEA